MQQRARRAGTAGWRVAGIAAAVIAAACHGSPRNTAGEPAHGDDSATAVPAGKLTQAQIAANDNADGERLMRGGKYADAAKKFEIALARDPLVAYFINHCNALLRSGELEYALRVCRSARNNDPTPAQRGQIEQLIKDIQQAGKAKGLDLCDGCIYEAPPDPPPH
jgi:hypothetical protein